MDYLNEFRPTPSHRVCTCAATRYNVGGIRVNDSRPILRVPQGPESWPLSRCSHWLILLARLTFVGNESYFRIALLKRKPG